MPDFLARLLLFLLAVGLRVHLYPLAKLAGGYRRYKPDPDSILVTCCTNGLGHVHQMERVLGELEAAGLRFPVIVLAKEQKVPAYKLASLKKRFPDAKFVNLNWEVDYDDGKSFQNSKIVWSATKSFTAMAPQMARKVSALLRTHRPAYCLSFWEPGVAMFIDILNAPTKVVAVASQGQIYADKEAGYDKNVLLRGVLQAVVGRRGTLVPLSVNEIPGAIPQIVNLGEAQPAGDYFVAYTTAPQVLSPIKKKLKGRVLLFVKEKRLPYYKRVYRKYPHVELRPTTPDFAEYLARSKGLIASPSRGVVTQAVALGKPVYLFCPKGHIEQEYNLQFYLKHFAGVSCPRARRYRRYVKGAKRGGKLPDGWRGALQSITEWEAAVPSLDLKAQAAELRGWLDRIDPLIRSRLLPLLTPTDEERAAMGGGADEPAPAAAPGVPAEEEEDLFEEEEEEEEEDDDDDLDEDDAANASRGDAAAAGGGGGGAAAAA